MKRVLSLTIAVCLLIGLCVFPASAKSPEQVAELSGTVNRMLFDGTYVENVLDFILDQRDTLPAASEKELLLCFWYLEAAMDVFEMQEANTIVHSEKDLDAMTESYENMTRSKASLDQLLEQYLAGNVERQKMVDTIVGLAEMMQEKQTKMIEQYGELAALIEQTGHTEEKGSEEPASTAAPAPDTARIPTNGEKNALASAQSYLGIMAFSYTGLIKQLEFEGYSKTEATYAADHCGADWDEQAVKSAKQYLQLMSFSKSGLINQLLYEGYTQAQAEAAVNKVY